MKRCYQTTLALYVVLSTHCCCFLVVDTALGEEDPKVASNPTPQEDTLEQRLEKIASDWERRKPKRAITVATNKYDEHLKEWRETASEDRNFAEFSERMLRIANEHHGDVGAREALIWVASAGRPGTHAKLRMRAVQSLIEHHANDTEVPRSLLMTTIPARHWDVLLDGFVAVSSESRGLARLALARYLKAKIVVCETGRIQNAFSDKLFTADYRGHLMSCDVEAMRKRMFQNAEEVVRDYHDIPYIRTGNYGALDFHDRKTLGGVAAALLDESRNFVVGKPAPAIEGKDLDGVEMTLAEHRDKVVVLVFWASWCGPCMQKMDEQQRLVKRLSDKPFALLGVNCDADIETAQKASLAANANWRSWFDGFPAIDAGPIVEHFHVASLPTTIVIDGKGIIRGKHFSETLVDKLIAEIDD